MLRQVSNDPTDFEIVKIQPVTGFTRSYLENIISGETVYSTYIKNIGRM
jgi:hypothetical protein